MQFIISGPLLTLNSFVLFENRILLNHGLESTRGVALYIIDSTHDKTYNKTCATSEDSDQPAHPRSLIRVFANRNCLI